MQTTTVETPRPQKKLEINTPVYPAPVGARAPGISMFDWLAAMAMQAFVSHGIKVKADRAMTEDDKDAELAERAYKMAGAMLRARDEAYKELK